MEIKKELLEPYIGKPVGIGIPHKIFPNETFFYYGNLLAVTKDAVHIRTKKGRLTVVLFDYIIELKTLEEQ